MEDNDYNDWEKAEKKAKTHNKKLLTGFRKWLTEKGLKKTTIKNHIFNVEFFINDFLTSYDIIPAEEGASHIGSFLGDYFIRKTSWASANTIKENITSIRKFYTYLLDIELINKSELAEMNEIIKDKKGGWICEVEEYWNESEEFDW